MKFSMATSLAAIAALEIAAAAPTANTHAPAEGIVGKTITWYRKPARGFNEIPLQNRPDHEHDATLKRRGSRGKPTWYDKDRIKNDKSCGKDGEGGCKGGCGCKGSPMGVPIPYIPSEPSSLRKGAKAWREGALDRDVTPTMGDTDIGMGPKKAPDGIEDLKIGRESMEKRGRKTEASKPKPKGPKPKTGGPKNKKKPSGKPRPKMKGKGRGKRAVLPRGGDQDTCGCKSNDKKKAPAPKAQSKSEPEPQGQPQPPAQPKTAPKAQPQQAKPQGQGKPQPQRRDPGKKRPKSKSNSRPEPEAKHEGFEWGMVEKSAERAAERVAEKAAEEAVEREWAERERAQGMDRSKGWK